MSLLRRINEHFFSPTKKLFDIPTQIERDGEYWFNEAYRKSKASKSDSLKCPWKDCDGNMLEGPSGGMSTNIRCSTCERKWNLTPMIGQMERI